MSELIPIENLRPHCPHGKEADLLREWSQRRSAEMFAESKLDADYKKAIDELNARQKPEPEPEPELKSETVAYADLLPGDVRLLGRFNGHPIARSDMRTWGIPDGTLEGRLLKLRNLGYLHQPYRGVWQRSPDAALGACRIKTPA